MHCRVLYFSLKKDIQAKTHNNLEVVKDISEIIDYYFK